MKSGRPRGRRTLATPETKRKILEAVRLGVSFRQAAQYAGISAPTLVLWQNLGAQGDPRFTEFLNEIEKARAACVVGHAAIVTKAAQGGDASLSMKMLERIGDGFDQKVNVRVLGELREAIDRLDEVFHALPPEKRLTPMEGLELALLAIARGGAAATASIGEDGGDAAAGDSPAGPAPAE